MVSMVTGSRTKDVELNVLVSVLLVDHGTVMILQRIRGKKNHYLRESCYLEPNSSSVDRQVAFKSGFWPVM